ncbi:VanZ family protein [Segetibacter sp. 3557_3]|uniref:VanZ family protein n=1 Tax=Segetibacter sp. 3557_3 TaxID=2547429 RepID=UPI0014052A57|nr:VanZ family protein [Segetibacter sp. 3557_3]
MRNLTDSFVPAICWLILSSILFFIPGDQLPREEIFALPNFDKLVHSFLFFILCYLFFRPVRHLENIATRKALYFKISLAAVFYGLVVEVIQKYFVVNRSFDLWDIIFDTLGCACAYLWARKYLVKVV